MIICFSGTGNTAMVARELSGRRGGEKIVNLRGTGRLGPDSLCASSDEDIIWAFPIYSWGVPPVVVDYMERVKIEGDQVHHLVCTCGDDIGLADRQWRRVAQKRGWSTGLAFSVEMPNTYVLMRGFDVDPADVAERKLRLMPERVAAIATRLETYAPGELEGPSDVVRGSFAWVKSKIIYPWFVRHDMSPKPFHATDACIGCGRCAATCPLANITMTAAHRPQWSSHCALCLGCYHVCPVHAVAYGKATASKGQRVSN